MINLIKFSLNLYFHSFIPKRIKVVKCIDPHLVITLRPTAPASNHCEFKRYIKMKYMYSVNWHYCRFGICNKYCATSEYYTLLSHYMYPLITHQTGLPTFHQGP